MTTLTIELPTAISQQLKQRNISTQQLTTIIIRLINLYLNYYKLQETVALVEDIFVTTSPVTDKMELMAQAVHDPMYMADLQETMQDFAEVDAEWWEPA